MQVIREWLSAGWGWVAGTEVVPLIALLLKISVPILAAWAVARLVSSAAVRHLVWGLALAGVAIVPILTVALPEVELAILPPSWEAPSSREAAPGEASVRDTVLGVSAFGGSSSGGGTPTIASGRAWTAPSNDSPEAVALEASPTDPAAARAATTPSSAIRANRRTLLAPGALLALGWLVGSLFLLARLLLDLRSRRELERSAVGVRDAEHRGELEALARRLGIGRRIELIQSDRLGIPATWGWRKPVIALPAGQECWPADLTRSVLLHELAHVRRFDAGVRTVAAAVCALCWPHPLVWGVVRAMRRESELACDDVVVAASAAPADYAEHLLELVRSTRAPVPRGVAAMAGRSGLRARIQAILDETRDRSTPSVRRRTVILLGMLCVILTAAAPVTLATQPASEGLRPGWGFATLGSVVDEARSSQSPPDPPAPPSTPPSPAAPSPPAPPAPAISAGGLAERCGDGSRSVSIEGTDDRERITVVTGRCKLWIDKRGDIAFLDDESGVAHMAPRSRLEIEEKRDGTRRAVEYRPGSNGEPEVSYLVDGRSAELDAEAGEWVATMIPMIFRMTGMQAEQRVARFLARGGPDAVLEEVRLIGSDYVQRIYLQELMAQADLTPAETRVWLSAAGEEIGSDYELAEALSGLPVRNLSRAELQEAFVRAAGTIGSDYELRRTLDRLLAQETVSMAVLEPLLEAAATIGSDFECAELLVSIARRYPDGAPLPKSYFEVVATIGSDYEMGRALGQVAGRSMDREALVSLLQAARDISSDHELAELLVRVIGAQGVPEGTRSDFDRALETIGSSYEHNRVLEVWHDAEGT